MLRGLLKMEPDLGYALSRIAVVEAVNKPADHLGDHFELQFDARRFRLSQEAATTGHLGNRHAFLRRTARDDEEVLAIGLRESAIPFRKVGRDRKCGAIQLIDKESIASRKAFAEPGKFIGKVDRLLIDLQVFEHEGHGSGSQKRRSRRTGEQVTAGERD